MRSAWRVVVDLPGRTKHVLKVRRRASWRSGASARGICSDGRRIRPISPPLGVRVNTRLWRRCGGSASRSSSGVVLAGRPQTTTLCSSLGAAQVGGLGVSPEREARHMETRVLMLMRHRWSAGARRFQVRDARVCSWAWLRPSGAFAQIWAAAAARRGLKWRLGRRWRVTVVQAAGLLSVCWLAGWAGVTGGDGAGWGIGAVGAVGVRFWVLGGLRGLVRLDEGLIWAEERSGERVGVLYRGGGGDLG